MPIPGMRQYNQLRHCAECGSPLQRWALTAKCDTCGQHVCPRHRGIFTPSWNCTACKKRQEAFLNSQQQPAPQPSQPLIAATEPSSLLRRAEALYADHKENEAGRLIDDIFYRIMTPSSDDE